MLTATGAKLLDFGVSKLQASPSIPALATVAHDARLTADGVLVGTFPYMSPEQLQGREPDVRSDIFAFGATVYEKATGRRPFEGATAATLIGAILHTDPPPVSTLQPLAPPALDHVVSRCLAKDPDDRWQTARDLMLELKSISEHDAPPATSRHRHAKFGLVGTAAFAVLAITALIAFAIDYRRVAPADAATVRLAFLPPEGLTSADLVIGGPVTISPDGERLAFVAITRDGRQLVWVRSVGSRDAQALPGSDGGAYPFWSPDGQFVGFFAQRKLKKVRLSEGPPQILSDAILPRGGTWSKDGVIVFSAGAGRQLYWVSAGGGTATPLPADGLNQERHWPFFPPDGRHFVYFGRPQKHGIYVGTIDSSSPRLLVSDYVGVAYSPGYLLLLVGPSFGAPAGTLMAQPFDPTRLQLIGAPTPVADRVGMNDRGDIVGAYTIAGVLHGFLLSEEVFTTVDVPGASSTGARGINPQGEIVGEYTSGGVTHGFLFSRGVFSTIDVPGASATNALGINASGDIVGAYTAGGVTRGFVLCK